MASSAIETYDLLAALFCLPGEFQQDPDVDEAFLSEFRDGNTTIHAPEALRCTINILLEDDASRSLALHVRLPFASSGGKTVKLHLAQPAWLERKPFDKLSEELRVSLQGGPGQEDPSALVMAAVEFLKENGPAYLPSASSRCEADVKVQRQPTDPLVYVRLPCPKDVQNLIIIQAGSGCIYLPYLHDPSARTWLTMHLHTTLRELSQQESQVCLYLKVQAQIPWNRIFPSSRHILGQIYQLVGSHPGRKDLGADFLSQVTRKSARNFVKRAYLSKTERSPTCRRLQTSSM